VHAPGFYLHLEPGQVFGGFGLWHPDAPTLAKVRDAIVGDPAAWKRVVGKQALDGEKLQRPPRGYDPDHPLVEDLKRKDFVVTAELSEKEACSPRFLDAYVDACRSGAPLVRFLTEAVGLRF
jgi:uncharacterized protein (TIGR02453 family)